MGLAVASLMAAAINKFAIGESPAREIAYDLQTLTLIATPPPCSPVPRGRGGGET